MNKPKKVAAAKVATAKVATTDATTNATTNATTDTTTNWLEYLNAILEIPHMKKILISSSLGIPLAVLLKRFIQKEITKKQKKHKKHKNHKKQKKQKKQNRHKKKNRRRSTYVI